MIIQYPKMYRYVFLFWLLLLFVDLSAQISRGGSPLPLFESELEVLNDMAESMPGLPLRVQQQYAVFDKPEKGTPLRFAHTYDVTLSPENSGYITKKNDGTAVWRLLIESKGAYSLNLIFDQFALAPGCSLYIYNPDQSVVLGAFTHQNNLPSGRFATAPIPGDQIIVEYHQSAGQSKRSLLEIGSVNHDFLDLFSLKSISRFNRSGSCNPDFTCETDDLWLEAGQSVARIMVNGRDLCSGTLINNTRQDGKPYFLTAAHCITDMNDPATAIFTFNYQVPGCDGRVEGAFTQTLSGSFLRAYVEDLDVTLLEMSEIPPAAYRPYWAGWDRTTNPQGEVTTIHHPEGDVKKVARSENAPTAASFNASSPGGVPFIGNSHWRIARWSEGTTERGSSGSPLFTNEGKLIGSLSGGSATCSNPVNDYFARLNRVWDYYEDESQQLAFWLDPDETGASSLDGLQYYNEQEKVLRLSNFLFEDVAGMEKYSGSSGFWSGHNLFGDQAFAEQYGPFSEVTLHGVYVMPARSDFSMTQDVNISVWQGVTEPEVKILSRSNINLLSLPANREYFWRFNESLNTHGNIWVGVELNYNTQTDSVVIYHSLYNPSKQVGTAWVMDANNQWKNLAERENSIYPVSFWIDLLVSNVRDLDTSNVAPTTTDFMVYPNPVINEIRFHIPDFTGYAKLELYNQSGQKVIEHRVPVLDSIGTVAHHGTFPGLYIYRLFAGDKIYNGKIYIKAD
ncbi:trypsin-like peptidase domain-containing protein [Natronoflexus pectinivorans]|uniref:Putative secreted protein (Por secretion system target) n=1 Tax=Natronoflexus pectinivorans TaxID=682526 RepID=A0A4R2GG08_9BACT|nr:trypsin-like peptidase domain-containing protein [Natronoflexus pectinivorans]TCO06950.1 putative secreted protein (Por secretion system target) [Natronoflexus pectinivorans]